MFLSDKRCFVRHKRQQFAAGREQVVLLPSRITFKI